MNKSTPLNGKDKYWKSGVGYGYTGRQEWDISSYVKEQDTKNKKISTIIGKIILQFGKFWLIKHIKIFQIISYLDLKAQVMELIQRL